MSADAPDEDELSPELAELFASERRRPGLTDARGDALLGRVLTEVAGPPGGDDGGGEGGTSSPAPPSAPASASTPSVRALPTPAAMLLGGAMGALVGALGHARWQRPPEPRVVRVVERVVERVEVPVPAVATPVTPPPSPVAPPAVAHAPPPTAPAVLAPDREREGALLERARMAMMRGRPTDGLQALDEHARTFPRGRLVEEREALAVQCLAAAGDTPRARARAEAFQRRFPGSPLTEVVLAAGR